MITTVPMRTPSRVPFITVPSPAGRDPDLSAVAKRLGSKIVLSPAAPPGSVEQYRALAATLHHAQTQTGMKIVMVASAMPGEGKTLTATNLALTLSESYRRKVLIIDADLRRPTMHQIFDIPNIAGLNEALTAFDGLPSAFELSPRLTLLPAGRPNPDPIGILTSPAMRELVRSAGDGFDWVIVDTPPVGLLTDANLLAGMVDAVIMVITAGKVSYKILQKSVEALGRERIIGVVLNRATDQPFGTSYKYGGYYGQPRPKP
jgi:protein-tyrosine kinase